MSHLLHSAGIADHVAELLAKHMAAANLLGRTQIANEVHRKTGKRIPLSTLSRFRPHHAQFVEGDGDKAVLTGGFNVSLPATDAANYLRGLTPVTKETFDGLSQQYKRDAFTVAGTADLRLIKEIRDQLAGVLQQGGTRADFEKAVAKLTTDAGVEALSAFTLDTVFTTNLQKAYALGRYEQMTDPDVVDALPYWQYMTVGDSRVRPEHAALDYFTARAQDPVWNKIYPPNGFNCRCIAVSLMAEEAPAGSEEPGFLRLPPLAALKVPQAGFAKVFPVAG